MNYSLTIFKSIFDNKTHRQMTFKSFDEFESTMKSLQKDVKRKPKKGERPNNETAALISPAIYGADGLLSILTTTMEPLIQCWIDLKPIGIFAIHQPVLQKKNLNVESSYPLQDLFRMKKLNTYGLPLIRNLEK